LQFQWMLQRPNMLFVRGHTHTPRDVTQCRRTRKIPLDCWYANAGTLGTVKPTYAERVSTLEWGPGVIVGEAVNRPNYNQKGRQWSAHLLTP
jgi:hypothetical protein